VFRERIVTERRANRVFLVVVGAVPVARALAWWDEGAPSPMFALFALTEIMMLFVLWLTTRRHAVR
jgi:hypothetical protein